MVAKLRPKKHESALAHFVQQMLTAAYSDAVEVVGHIGIALLCGTTCFLVNQQRMGFFACLGCCSVFYSSLSR